MSRRSRPFIFRLEGNDAFQVAFKVTLRKISDSTGQLNLNSMTEENNDGVRASKSKPEPSPKSESYSVVETCFSWQEKVVGPHEILIQYLQETDNEKRKYRPDNHPLSRVAEVVGDLRAHQALNFQESMIYTYVDSDYFTQAPAKNQSERTHLEAGMWSIPAHNLHTRDTLSVKSASRVHERVSREDPCQFFHVMAAVDCDVTGLKRLATNASEASNDDIHSGLDQIKHLFHEELLCTLKYYTSRGVLEVSPGFSEEEPEDFEDNRIFVTSESLNIRRNAGVRLTTFSFTTPRGSLYEYTIERRYNFTSLDDVERAAISKADERYQKTAERRRSHFEKITLKRNSGCSESSQNSQRAILLEIVSASDISLCRFNTVSPISIEYDITMPSCWTLTQPTKRKKDVCKTSIDSKSDKSNIITGSIQQTRPVCYSGNVSMAIGLRLLLILIMAVLAETILIFQEYIWWILTTTLLLCVLLEDYSRHGETLKPAVYHFGHLISLHQVESAITDESFSVDHSLSLFIQLCSDKGNDARSIEGYGAVRLPEEPGSYDFCMSLWKPVAGGGMGEIQYRMHDYYFGCASNELDYMKHIVAGPFLPSLARDNGNITSVSCLNRSKTTIQESGSIRLRMHVLSTTMFQEKDFQRTNIPERHPVFRETIDEVLSRVRRNKRHRLMQNIIEKGTTGRLQTIYNQSENIEETDTDANPRTAEILARIKSRQKFRSRDI